MKIVVVIITLIIIPLVILRIFYHFVASIVADRFPAKKPKKEKVIYFHIASWEDDLYAV